MRFLFVTVSRQDLSHCFFEPDKRDEEWKAIFGKLAALSIPCLKLEYVVESVLQGKLLAPETFEFKAEQVPQVTTRSKRTPK